MSQENLPVELRNNQLAEKKRENKRIIEGIKRVGKIALSAGIAVSGLAVTAIGGPVASAVGFGLYVGGAANAGMDAIYKKISKNSMFVQRKNAKGEIKGIATEESRARENNLYPQVYSTTTHSVNIDTIEALEQLGYLQIERKEAKRKSNLFFEKMGFGQHKEAMEAIFSKDESKKVQMYDLALKVTDKAIDFEEIYKSYTQVRGSREKTPNTAATKRIGIILEALRNRNIDIVRNDIGETVIDYKAEEPFARRMKRKQINSSAEYRKANYIGDKIDQGPVQIQEQTQEGLSKETIQASEIEQ